MPGHADPAFDTLANTLIPCRFFDRECDIRTHKPVITLDHTGAIQEIRINAVPEPPPSIFDVDGQVDVHELLAVERRRYEKLLAERTRIIKETVERQANAMLAKKDAEMREQVLAKMRVLREERDRLLAHAKVLEAERLALAQERAAFTAEQLTAGRILQEA